MAFSPCLFALWSSMVEVDKMIRYLHLKCTVFFVTLCPEKKKKLLLEPFHGVFKAVYQLNHSSTSENLAYVMNETRL